MVSWSSEVDACVCAEVAPDLVGPPSGALPVDGLVVVAGRPPVAVGLSQGEQPVTVLEQWRAESTGFLCTRGLNIFRASTPLKRGQEYELTIVDRLGPTEFESRFTGVPSDSWELRHTTLSMSHDWVETDPEEPGSCSDDPLLGRLTTGFVAVGLKVEPPAPALLTLAIGDTAVEEIVSTGATFSLDHETEHWVVNGVAAASVPLLASTASCLTARVWSLDATLVAEEELCRSTASKEPRYLGTAAVKVWPEESRPAESTGCAIGSRHPAGVSLWGLVAALLLLTRKLR